MGVFMKVDAGGGREGIQGDSKFAKHEGWIVCESCTIPTTRPESQTTMGKVTDRTRANLDFEDMQVKKAMDKASPGLMRWNLYGDARTVTVHFTDEKEWYLQLILKNVILTKLDIDADAEGAASETLSLDFTYIDYQYRTKQPDGKTYDAAIKMEYDIALGEVQ
ncbi:MAG: type VI secretion system tube protein Hcp [Planctomycetota bacterium]